MDAIVNWVNQGKNPTERHAWHNGTTIMIETLEGTMVASVKDWIIRGVEENTHASLTSSTRPTKPYEP